MQFLPAVSHGESRFKTDDRGVYRVYGLPAGRYIVGVQSRGRSQLTSTFHPGVTEESEAKPIDVLAGKVVENVDIKLPPITRPLAFEVSGRVVDEATGQPIPKIRVGRDTLEIAGKKVSQCCDGMVVDERGEFRFPNLLPGRYAVYVPIDSLSEYYSDQVVFEVVDQGVAGLEIKARRAASLSGKVVIEGTRDPAILSDLSNMHITVFRMTGGLGTGVEAGADGRFRIPGLPPDKFRFELFYPKTQQRGFFLLGVERDGVLQTAGIDVTAGEQVTGLRLIVAYGEGVVSGQVQVVGGSLPEGARLSVHARRADVQGRPGSASVESVDARGRFLLEGLATGAHEITLTVYVPSQPGATMPIRQWASVKQTVSVTSGAESQVTLVLDVNASNGKEKKQ